MVLMSDAEVSVYICFFFSSRRRHTRYWRDWSSDVCSSDLTERVVWTDELAVTAARLQLDLQLVRLPEDPADWLLKHSPEEFTQFLKGAVPILEYSIRRIANENRGSDAISRSKTVPKARELIDKIEDSVLRREAIRLASDALGVDPSVLEEERRASAAPTRSPKLMANPTDPHQQAGKEVLAVLLARPYLTASLLKDGLRVSSLPDPVSLRPEDFWDELQADVFSLVREHAGEGFDDVVADERARPFMDQLGALAARAEEIQCGDLYPSGRPVQEILLRLVILSRQRDKRETTNRKSVV